MATESSASTTWRGSLEKGSGTTHPESAAFQDVEVTWAARTTRSAGKTSPEELLAAAHASCYCMALSHELSEAGSEPEQLTTTATIAFVPGEGVKSSHIVVNGRVPGIDESQFEDAAQSAGKNCPISGALTGNIEITVEATLDS
ncbi:MAG TPA: OsmC family peroxiredoxin [Acidimicrobiales bacterium]|nr:OsmC family peroxiredoxin [Acidimicrobiales bacterium]